MKAFCSAILMLGLVFGTLSEKRSHNQPHWLEECWDHGEGHFVNPLCELLSTTPSTTTTTEPTTTTTEPTTTTTEATTTTTEATTTTTEPTTTTTLPPTTTPRTCDYIVFNESDIKRTDFGHDAHVNAARLRNETVHVTNSLDACKTTCANSLLQDNYECWAFTFNPDERCYLYYYDRPLLFIPSTIKVNGTTLFLKRCSDNPFANNTRPPTPSATPQTVVTPVVNVNSSTSPSGSPANVSLESTTPTIPAVTGSPTPTPGHGTPSPDTGSTSAAPVPVTDTTSPPSATSSVSTGGSSTPQTPVSGPAVVTGSTSGSGAVTPGTGQPPVTSGVPVVVTGAVTGVPSFLGVTNAPGGLVQISKDTFRINGVPSPTPDKCFFMNQTFDNGTSWKTTCRYNCTCTTTGTVNTATCHDVCPFYINIPSNCQRVKKPGDCCDSLNCTGPTVPTPTVNGTDCVDHNESCLYYKDTSCKSPYVPWAKANCPLRCDFCPGKAYPCQNEISYCDQFDLDDACKNYKGWARQNCRLACSMCNVPGWNPEGVNVPSATTTQGAPPVST